MDAIDTDAERLIRRATPLLFGIYGRRLDQEGQLVTRAGGSGIFVAPFTGLTAKHVTRDIMRLDERFDALPQGTFSAQYSCAIFQLHNHFTGDTQTATWELKESWHGPFTDMALMHVAAESGLSESLQLQLPTYTFDWLLLPPPLGAMVAILGYPDTDLTVVGDKLRIESSFIFQRATVVAVHEPFRDRGMLNFPCFAIDKQVPHGLSGWPRLLRRQAMRYTKFWIEF